MDPQSKADHLAEAFSAKFKLNAREVNDYTEIEESRYRSQGSLDTLTELKAETYLKNLRMDSATGPDELPTRILRECAKQLARPVAQLARKILEEGRWPEIWIMHWVIPLYKKNSVQGNTFDVPAIEGNGENA